MRVRTKLSFIATAALAALSLAPAAQAAAISGSYWHVPEAVSQNAVPANVPVTAPDVAFDVNSPFNFSGTSTTVGNWLASSAAYNIAENTPGTLTSLLDNGTQGSILKFTGFVTVTSGQTFTVTHDDGLTLKIGATDLGFNPGPTSPTVSTATYSGPSGNYPFELVYGECCGGPAVLQIDLPFSNVPTVPDSGSTLAMLGLAIGRMAAVRRRQQAA